jgi:hypothetical protein
MYFELIRDAAGQTNQPYERSVQDLNMHGRGFARKFNRRGVKLLLGWAGKGTTKALSFEPRLTSHKKISERGTVLIVDLSDLGHEPAAIFGAIIINAFKQAADASEIRSGRTVSISTSFRTSIISTILSESRKRGLFLTLAHQFISQLDEEIRDAVLGNCSTIISFRVGPNDAPLLGKQSTIGRKTSKNWDWVRPVCPRSLLATLKRSPPAALVGGAHPSARQ